MSDSAGEATSHDTADVALHWREVVHSEQFSEPVRRPIARGWSWRYTWLILRYSVMPLLVTAIALTTVLLTLIGLVARPFPWSPQPLLGGALPHSHVSPPSNSSPQNPNPARTGAAAAPTDGAGPGGLASPAGSGVLAVPTGAGPTASPSGTAAAPTAGVGVTLGVGLPPLLPSGLLPLPSVTVSVGVSLPVPLPTIQLPGLPPVALPPISVTVPPVALPVQLPLPSVSLGVLP